MKRQGLSKGDQTISKRYIGSRKVWEGLAKLSGTVGQWYSIRDDSLYVRLPEHKQVPAYEFNKYYPINEIKKVVLGGREVTTGYIEWRVWEYDYTAIGIILYGKSFSPSGEAYEEGATVEIYYK